MKTSALSYDKGIEMMRRPGTRLVQMHSGQGLAWFLVPGGPVSSGVADRIRNHPLVRAKRDDLFPGLSHSWSMIVDKRPESAS
jgi:hypothetical protein